MVNGRRIAGAHITSGMELPGPQRRYLGSYLVPLKSLKPLELDI